MQIRMEYPDRWSIEQIRKFVEGSGELELQGQSRKAVYAWVRATLIHQEYASRKRSEKGLIRGFLSKVSGRSVPQITRLIRQFLGSFAPGQRHGSIRVRNFGRLRATLGGATSNGSRPD